MTQGDIIAVMEEATFTMLILSLPLLGIGLLIGVVVSIFQATTQINEQTLSFVPKLIAIMLTLIFTFGWMMTTAEDFTRRLFDFVLTIM